MNDPTNQSVKAAKNIAHLKFLTGGPLDSLLVQLAGSRVSPPSDFAPPSELMEKCDNDTAFNASDGTNVPDLKPQRVTTDINRKSDDADPCVNSFVQRFKQSRKC